MADLPIPIFHSLEEIHADKTRALLQAERWNELVEKFQAIFGSKATHIARAPGRVNLIGEHIDYALFGVLPTAVEPDILIALAPSSEPGGRIVVENMDERYEKQEFFAHRSNGEWFLDLDKTKLRWDSYVKAGYYGVLNRFLSGPDAKPTSINMLYTGSVPAGSGLSSSAAMVVASTLSFLVMNDKLGEMTKGDLVRMSMQNEQRVGVNSGGMDQAASVISTPSAALYITFYPELHSAPVQLPHTHPAPVFVISNSLVVSDKAVSAKWNYNLRVLETLVAARIMALGLGVIVGKNERITLREVIGRWAGEKEGEDMGPEKLEETLLKAEGEVDRILGAGNGRSGMTREEMIAASGLNESAFNDLYLSRMEVEATTFKLYARGKHVISEALRVLHFRKVCSAFDSAQSSSATEDMLRQLGNLMNESQESCAKLFECSCKELDELTALARSAGAYGSRLTGAGWGGCAVSLVAEDNVQAFIQHVGENFPPYKNLDKAWLDEVLFATKPSSGAGVYIVE